jgi:hypothetical protein
VGSSLFSGSPEADERARAFDRSADDPENLEELENDFARSNERG